MASTQSTGSEHDRAGRYDFSFGWDGPYGHSVRLIERLRPVEGVVLDLGCGHGAVAEPLAERGYEYVGVDVDTDALAHVAGRGFEVHEVDLAATAAIADRLVEVAAGRRVAAMFVLDVLEHLPGTPATLGALREALDRLDRPLFIVSVPNVAHVDIAAKLVFGRWDYTRTGLLDDTHISFFTAERLRTVTAACGLRQLEEYDVVFEPSDQRFPPLHPGLADGSPPAELIRGWRRAADPHASTVQFVRAFVANDFEALPAAEAEPVPGLPLSVVTRTQGRRPDALRDALTCLAAQTVDAFEVLLMVHTDNPDQLAAVAGIVGEFDPTFADRVAVVPVPESEGGRARPLNRALERFRGDYVAFLDDDDLVTADWVESFCSGIGSGAIIRSVSALRDVAPAPSGSCTPYLVTSGLQCVYSPEFDLAHHLWQNNSPICSYAVPRSVIDTMGLRFDEGLPVLEDWDFLMRCVSFAAVRDTGRLTSVYQMWRQGESSSSLHHAELWAALARVLQERMNSQPLVLPPGAVEQLVEFRQRALEDRLALAAAAQEMAGERKRAADELHAVKEHLEYVTEEYRALERKYRYVVGSRRWRILERPARLVARLRQAGRRSGLARR